MADEGAQVTMELVYEVLKKLQQGQADLATGLRDVKESIISLREDVHGTRGDLLRHEKALAALESDIGRIKVRLDLRDR